MKTLYGHVDNFGDEFYLLDTEVRRDSAAFFIAAIVSKNGTVGVNLGLADLMQLRDKVQEAIHEFITDGEE